MMRKLCAVLVVCALTSLCTAGTIISKVAPEGDGHNGRARYGYGFPWESTGFDSSTTSNWAGHWYDAPYGAASDVYMQFSLASLPAGAAIQQATLNIYVTECSGSGGQLFHRTDSSTANGLASQLLGGDMKIADILTSAGWYSIDVTSYIQSDIEKGHKWAVFSLPSTGYSSLTFDSGETANAAYLSVAIPEPATLIMLGLGALPMLRRKK